MALNEGQRPLTAIQRSVCDYDHTWHHQVLGIAFHVSQIPEFGHDAKTGKYCHQANVVITECLPPATRLRKTSELDFKIKPQNHNEVFQ
jgi:hypothetical protein